MGKRITRAALAALVLAALVLAALVVGLPPVGPAGAQVGPDARPYIYGRPGPDRFEYAPPRPNHRPPPPPADDDWDWPRRPPPPPPYDGYDRPPYPRRGPYVRRGWEDAICVTARGTCPTPAGPPNTPCACEIPGFGYKRGQIGD